MIHLTSLLHTMTAYANRWGGARWRTEELAKFLNKHLYNIQEEQLRNGQRVNLCLAHDAFLSSRHLPLYPSSILNIGEWAAYKIKDELGFEAVFSKGTEILIHKDEIIRFEKIENLKPGDRRVINFEVVPEFDNDKMNHYNAFTDNFISIKCEPEEIQQLMCDSLNAMMILKEQSGSLIRIDRFDSRNEQEIHLIDIVSVEEIEPHLFFYLEFNKFSYSLRKNRELSNKSQKRYYNYRQRTVGKRWLEKMRSKVFAMKKDNTIFAMELKHANNKD